VNTSEKIFTLPEDSEEIIQRLTSVTDEPILVRDLYPLIAEQAGDDKHPSGIIMMFETAIHELGQHGYPPPLTAVIRWHIPGWINALVDDQETVDLALAFLKEVNERMLQKQ
jgi:hypothetical protein